MRRVATAALIVSLAAVAVALPAGAANLRVARGSLVAVSATSVSVKTAKGTVSCKLGAKSPSQGGFVTGEHVQIACRRAGGHWLLTVLRHVGIEDHAPRTTPRRRRSSAARSPTSPIPRSACTTAIAT